MLLDTYAYANRWRQQHPAEKGLLCLLALGAALLARSPQAAAICALVMAALTVGGAGIALRNYLRLLRLPAGFLFAGVFGLALSLSGGDQLLLDLPGLDLSLWLNHAGADQALLVLSRSLAAVTALLFLALTTPMTEIVALLRRLRMPALLLELMVLAYRQIHVFSEVARQMRTAQKARLGDAGLASRWRSLSSLAAGLYLKAHLRSQQLHRSLLCRGYDHDLRWLERQAALSGRNLLGAIALGGSLLALALLLPA